MHSPLYLATPPDEPTRVMLPAPRGATKVYENDMGEFGTRLYIYRWLRDAATAARGASGCQPSSCRGRPDRPAPVVVRPVRAGPER